MLSTYSTLERLTARPRVLDVDDAIYLHRGGGFAQRLAGMADLVICGNAYLANWFKRYARKVVILPTGIDTAVYCPSKSGRGRNGVIGWIGTAGNMKYLHAIEPALQRIVASNPDVTIRVISDAKPTFVGLTARNVEYKTWSASTEVDDIRGFDVGIMPLEDTPWTRGKCSFKMLQYMACGVPAIVSPVGTNTDVLNRGRCALAADTVPQWIEALSAALYEDSLRDDLIRTGRHVALNHFSIDVLAPQLAQYLKMTAESRFAL
jgi:glycosyltransferase involved in cell wall biosynthesis